MMIKINENAWVQKSHILRVSISPMTTATADVWLVGGQVVHLGPSWGETLEARVKNLIAELDKP